MTQGELRSSCPDCNVWTGERHAKDCGQARCEGTGLRWLECPGKEESDWHSPDRYQGVWASAADCRRLGWAVRWDGRRFLRCTPDEPNSGPDIDRLAQQAVWQREAGRWDKRRAVLYLRATNEEVADAEGNYPSEITMQLEQLREWADEEGYAIVGEYVDFGRIGRGFKQVLQMVQFEAEAVLVLDQKHLGATGKTRHGSAEKIKAAGGNLRSKSLWWSGLTPATYRERARAAARAAMPPRSEEP